MSAEHPVEVPDFSELEIARLRAMVREEVEPLKDVLVELTAFCSKVTRVIELLTEDGK